MQGRAIFLRNELFGDGHGFHFGQTNLRLFASLQQSKLGLRLLSQIDVMFFMEIFSHKIEQQVVDIIPAQLCITLAGQHFDHTRFQADN